MQLFIFVEGLLQLNAPEIALIKEFNNILVHSEKCESDPTGQKKYFAYMKFNYIWQLSDYGSYVHQHGLSQKEAHNYAISVSGLPKDWQPDDMTKSAIERYKQLRSSPARELNEEIVRTLHTSSKIVGKLNRYLEKQLEKIDYKDEDITLITTQHFKVIEISKKIPEQLEALEKNKELIDKEEGNVNKLRGGEQIEESMNPSNNVENLEDNED